MNVHAASPGRGAAGPAPATPRVGAELRAARLRLGRDLPDMAAGLRLKPGYLEALEDGRVADLPGLAYAAGFLRGYAGALGLDADAIVRRFRAEAGGMGRRTELAFPAPVPERGVPAGAAVLLVVLLAVGGYAGWYGLSGDARTPAAPVPPVPERLAPLAQGAAPFAPSPQVASILPPPGSVPAPVRPAPGQAASVQASPDGPPRAVQPGPETAGATPPAPAPFPPAPPATVSPTQAAAAAQPPRSTGSAAEGRPEGRIVLRAKSDVWVQVRERQGPSLLNRLLRTGETWPVPAGPALLLTTGNAAGTEVLVDGAAVAPLGGSGAVRRDVPLDPEALKAAEAKVAETRTAEAAKLADALKAGQSASQNAGQPGARAAASASTSRPPAQ